MDSSKVLCVKAPVLGASKSLAWQCACTEVRDGYGDGYVWLQKPKPKLTMRGLCMQLNIIPKQADDITLRNKELEVLLISLRDAGAVEYP